MVANQSPMLELNARWLGYLVLSLCINALIVCNIQMGAVDYVPAKVTGIRVALKAMIAPESSVATEPLETQADRQVQKPQPQPRKVLQQKPLLRKQPILQEQKVVKTQVVEKPVISTPQSTEKWQVKQLEVDTPTDDIIADIETAETSENIAVEKMSANLPNQSSEAIPDRVDRAAEVPHADSDKAMPLGELQRDLPQHQALSADVVYEAQYRRKTPPVYPSRALELGQQGVVTLHAKVMPSGHPDEIKVVSSSGYRLLDKAALAAVRKWEFVPTNVNGQAIVSWVSVPVNFVIQ